MVLKQLVRISPPVALWCLLGSIGLLVGGLRSLAVLVMGTEEMPSAEKLNRLDQILIISGMVTLLIMGIFPNWFLGLLVPG
jgi:succinate dehydrogenase/fumarate reductase cytochrome b subunit